MATTFKLSAYDGPATIAGVAFPVVHLREQAESTTTGIRKSWCGEAEGTREQAPEITPDWIESVGETIIELPGIGTGTCYVTSMKLINGYRWELEIVGRGPSPMD